MKGDGRKKKWTIVFLVLNHSFGDTVGKVSVIRLPALEFFFFLCVQLRGNKTAINI